jgi:hypothetical protein
MYGVVLLSEDSAGAKNHRSRHTTATGVVLAGLVAHGLDVVSVWLT